jgi:DNA-binding NarL/FixJ family response regulator
LVPLARHATDPLVRSNFLAQSAYLAAARSEYSAALGLSDEALELSNALHHDFATGCCLAYRAAAKIGLRQLASAASDVGLLIQTTAHQEDPYLQTQRALTEARLSIARRDLLFARAKLEQPSRRDPSAATLGERIALLAVVIASLGETRKALEYAEEARRITSATEAQYLSAFSELIANFSSSDHSRTCTVVTEAFLADYTDSFVTAYRAFPQLLQAAASDPKTVDLISPIVINACDRKLAQKAGIKLAGQSAESGDLLTTREQEVLELLSLGLSNAEIAQRLFIAPSTVKVHVRHILEKLGVRNRVQAALVAKREE